MLCRFFNVIRLPAAITFWRFVDNLGYQPSQIAFERDEHPYLGARNSAGRCDLRSDYMQEIACMNDNVLNRIGFYHRLPYKIQVLSRFFSNN